MGLYWKGVAFFFCQMLVGSGNDIVAKFMGQRLDALEVTFFRFFFGLITLLPFMIAEEMRSPEFQKLSRKKALYSDNIKLFEQALNRIKQSILGTRQLSLNVWRGILGALSFFLYTYSVISLPLAEVVIILWVIPLFSLVLSKVLLNEKVTTFRWIATVIGFVGLSVITTYNSNHKFSFNLLYLIPIGASFLFALQDIIIKKLVTARESNVTMLFYFSLITSIATFLPALKVWETPTLFELSMLFLLGFGGNLIQYFIFKAFSLVDVSAIAPYRYLELLISAFFAFIFFKEIPGLNVYLGALILIPSTLYLGYSERKSTRKISQQKEIK